MFSTLSKLLGQAVGETVHQADKLIDTTIEAGSTLASDIASIPEAFTAGYDEEIFETKQTQPTEDKPTSIFTQDENS